MKKRPKKRRVKRTAKGQDRRRRQQLSRDVKALYPPGSSDSGSDEDWHDGLESEYEPRPRRKPGRRRGKVPATEAGDQEAAPELRGRIVAISSGACRVEHEGRAFDCVLPSDLARDQRAAVAVGDEVVFAAHDAETYRLRRVLDRRTTLSRPDPHNPRLERVIAANIDVAVHVASVVEPPLRPALIDRYLIAIDRGGAKAVVCVNKIDLLSGDDERRRELERLDAYREMIGDILPCSARTGEGLDELRALLAGKTAVFAGHSGVGKSSIINALAPDTGAATGHTDGRGKGRHTTTHSSFYRIAADIRIIDTPGIRELGLWQLTTDELRAYFPDFAPYSSHCRFNDCSHSHEPDCAVRAAVEDGNVARARFETYLRILSSLETGD